MKNSNKIRTVMVLLVLMGIGITLWWFTRPGPFLYAGTVEGIEVTLSARVAGVIEDIAVIEGSAVKAGQILITLAGEDLKLSADLAAKEYRRAQRLLKSGALPKAEYDKIQFHYEKAQLAVTWCTIRAPRAGRVENIYKESGELVGPGVQLLSLTNSETIWVFVYVAQPKLAGLSQGREVHGFLPEMPGKIFKGKIAMVRDQAEFTPKNVQTRNERTRLVYGVKIMFDNPERLLKPGMTLEVILPEK